MAETRAPRVEKLRLPDRDPRGFTRADRHIERLAKFRWEVDEYVRGPAPRAAFYPGINDAVPEPTLEVVYVPLSLFDKLKRRSHAYESLLEAFTYALELAHNTDMARLALIEAQAKSAPRPEEVP